MKALKGITFCLSITTVAAVIVIILMFNGVINICPKSECDCKNTKEVSVDEKELSKIKSGDYNYTKSVGDKYGSFFLLTNGKISIDFDRELSNINNAKDIAKLNDYLYILTKDGKVYKYFTGITKTISLEAEELDIQGEVVQLVEYGTRGKSAGGCNYIVGIMKDGTYKTIEEFCV